MILLPHTPALFMMPLIETAGLKVSACSHTYVLTALKCRFFNKQDEKLKPNKNEKQQQQKQTAVYFKSTFRSLTLFYFNPLSIFFTSFFFYYFLSLFYTRRRSCVESTCVFNCSLCVIIQASTFLYSCSILCCVLCLFNSY